MQKITAYLWFDKQAEEAMKFYVDVFNGAPNKQAESKIVSVKRYPKGGQGPMAGMDGKVLNGVFELAGQQFMALDGGPIFKFTEALSLYVECVDQTEVDYFWSKLSATPEAEQCGWLKDKFGLSWQIIPTKLGELLSSTDREKATRATQAMLQMKKIVIQDLQDAYDGKK
jgi:predicted 3-demethylubiquinone-9 3-methyltransferase (glyoxalase superfamily)